MPHDVITSTSISATPGEVWAVLLRFAEYGKWNPFIRSVEGHASVGSTLKVTIEPPSGTRMTFRPVVLRLDTEREFRWQGRFLFRGLFDGEHYFLLAPISDGATQLTHGERFRGILVPLFRSSLEGGTKRGFEAMNVALKELVETSAAQSRTDEPSAPVL